MPVIAHETSRSPKAVDNYALDFARVYFATVQRGMIIVQTTFASGTLRALRMTPPRKVSGSEISWRNTCMSERLAPTRGGGKMAFDIHDCLGLSYPAASFTSANRFVPPRRNH